MLVTNNQF